MRAVISQRVDVIDARGERRDALDQAWGATLDRLAGRPVMALALANRPDAAAALLDHWRPQWIVLSGGNDLGEAPERDRTEGLLLDYAAAHAVPVLAVCRGMQRMQQHLGGNLVRLAGHVRCSHVVRPAASGALPELTVNSYHQWGIRADSLATGLQALYLHDDGSVEAARHRSLPWLAVMWHPERSVPGDPAAVAWLTQWLQEVSA